MEVYPVKVECIKKRRKIHRRKLWRCGLSWNGEDGFEGYVSKKKIEKISIYCRRNRLRYYIDNRFAKRSSDYRTKFFENNKPVFGQSYICAYCGWPVHKDNVTVDHLYPVAAVSQSISLQKKLKRHGIEDINDVKNLVPSCRSCNSRKGKKLGIWIFRGKIGRYPRIWLCRHILRLSIIGSLFAWLYINGYIEMIGEYFALNK